MTYAESMDSQYLKGEFKRAFVMNNGGTWVVQGDFPGSSHNLSGPPTDLVSARTAAETYVTGLGWIQIAVWADRSSTESRSVWFLPA